MLKTHRINQFFDLAGARIIQLRYLVLLGFVLVLAMGFSGLPRLTTDAGWDKWMLDNSELKRTEDEFKDIFGNSDYVGVLVTAPDIFTPKNLALIRELGNELKAKVPFSDDVLSLADCEFSLGDEDGITIINLVPETIPTHPAALAEIRQKALSKNLLKGRLVSADGTQSWIILRLTPFPEGWRDENNKAAEMVVGQTAVEIIRQSKYRDLNPKSSGMPVIAHDKTKFFMKEVKRTMGISLVVTLVVLSLAMRSLRGVLSAITIALSSVITTFGIFGWIGKPIDVASIMMPLYLGIAVSVSYSIHIFSFYNREMKETGLRRPSICHAVRETGWPILFTALTTMAALSSFHFVDVKPVRWVGSATAILVAVTFIMILFVMPVFLSFGRDKIPVKSNGRSRKGLNASIDSGLGALGNFVMDRSKGILVIFTALILVSAMGMRYFEVNFDILKTMGVKIPYVNRLHQVAQSDLGALYSYNLVVDFKTEGMAREPENLKKLERLLHTANSLPLTKKTTSIVEIIQDMHQVLNQGDPAFHTIPDTRQMVAQVMLLYENAGGREAEKWVDYEYRRFRFMVDLKHYNTVEVNRELNLLKAEARRLFPGARIYLAGTVPQFTVMQDLVSRGQLTSFMAAMVVISLLLIIVFNSVKTGLVAMIPNITPALAVGGIMGWFGIPLDMTTITIMPMLLGLAVDDTIHFIAHAKMEFERCKDYRQSVVRSFSAVGLPLLFTSMIISANFSVYLTSPANMYVFIGTLTITGIMAALLTDYFVTPILLSMLKAFGPDKHTVVTRASGSDSPGVHP